MRKLKALLLAMALLFGCGFAMAGNGYAVFTGKKLPIVGYVTQDRSGYVSGKYAYKSTLNKYGNKTASWLYISGNPDNGSLTVKDSKGKVVERWYDFKYSGGKWSANVTAINGHRYSLWFND